MESQYFIFNGINSIDMGLHVVRMDTGLITTPYYSGAEIVEEKVFRRHIPYFFGVDRRPLEFKLQFSLLEGEWTTKKRYEIARWLFHDDYKLFQSTDDISKHYYVIFTDEGELNLASTKGYVELTCRCDAPWAWSPIYINSFDLLENNTNTVIELENKSNLSGYYYPKIEIQMGESTGISLKNLSDNGRIFSFSNLENNEIISIDNDKKIIKSDFIGMYRYNNFNKNWLRLVYGINRLEVTGKCIIQTKMQFPLIV